MFSVLSDRNYMIHEISGQGVGVTENILLYGSKDAVHFKLNRLEDYDYILILFKIIALLIVNMSNMKFC